MTAGVSRENTLCNAIIENHISEVQKLVPKININQCIHNGKTPLYVAVEQNHYDIVQLLLNMRADPNIGTEGEFIIDKYSCGSGWSSDEEFEVDDSRWVGHRITPLWHAVTNELTDIAELLLEYKASPEIEPVDEWYGQKLIAVCVSQGQSSLARMLSENSTENACFYDLNLAIISEDFDFIQSVLNRFIPKTTKEEFLLAVLSGDGELVKQKLSDIENIFNITNTGKSIFELLSIMNNWDVLDSIHDILKEKIDSCPVDSEGRTPLIWATINGCFDDVEGLLELGVDPDITDHFAKAALDYAMKQLGYELASLLADYGANIDKAIEAAEDELDTPEGAVEMLKQLVGRGVKKAEQD